MKKICVRGLFFIFSFINLSFAEAEYDTRTIVRAICNQNDKTIDISLNFFDNTQLTEYFKLSRKQQKEQGLFDICNDGYELKEDNFHKKCIIDNKIYNLDFHIKNHIDRYSLLTLNFTQQETSSNNAIFSKRFTLLEDYSGIPGYIQSICFDTKTDTFTIKKLFTTYDITKNNPNISTKNLWETITKINDEIKIFKFHKTQDTHLDYTSNDDTTNFFINNEEASFSIICSPILETIEIKNTKQKNTSSLETQCKISNNTYTITIDKEAKLTIKKDSYNIIKSLNLYTINQKQLLHYLRYNHNNSINIEWFENSKIKYNYIIDLPQKNMPLTNEEIYTKKSNGPIYKTW